MERNYCKSAAPLWWLTKDGDLDCLEMYERHYSCYDYRDGRSRILFVGPGDKLVLRTEHGDALFVWRKFIDDADDGSGARQAGINCAAFRNESKHLSSELICQADAIADCWWTDSRHYTYVNPKEIASTNPGYCFLKAGWQRCGKTKKGLIIMEKLSIEVREIRRRKG